MKLRWHEVIAVFVIAPILLGLAALSWWTWTRSEWDGDE